MAEQSNEKAAQMAFMCQFCDQQNIKWKCVDCGVFLCDSCKEIIHTSSRSSDKHRILSIKDIGKVMSTFTINEIQCNDNEPWFHGQMKRIEAEKLLQKYKYMGDGAFLVRESETEKGNYSLDVLANDKPLHIRIYTKEESGHLQFVSGNCAGYNSLKDIINSYKKRSMTRTVYGDLFTLTEPVPKEPTCDN
ncbi:PLCG1 [Mytilus coruscus]|uniref:PLCG1 n=1 Tax=Mytilus coruscus TaxID=42192 RepID=A0A6J8END8_MYTCO|nr:PLCG1 [Mytilus coruscus]